MQKKDPFQSLNDAALLIHANKFEQAALLLTQQQQQQRDDGDTTGGSPNNSVVNIMAPAQCDSIAVDMLAAARRQCAMPSWLYG